MILTPELVNETALFLKNSGFHQANVGVVMGTGLGAMADKIENPVSIPYSAIPNFPEATVEFHMGNLIFGKVGTTNVLAMKDTFQISAG